MSRIRANQITNQSADGAPTVQNGLIISGVTTVTTLDLNGDLDVDGHTNLDNLSISGVTTVTTLDLNGDLDVDGHTNLDNLSISGITTISRTGGNGLLKVERVSGAGLHIQAQTGLGVFGTTSNHDLRFISNGNERMLLSTNGRVGINESSPDQLLHIKDSNPFIEIEGTTNNSGDVGIFLNANGNHWQMRADNYPSSNAFSIKSGTPASSTHRFIVSDTYIDTGTQTITGGNNLALQNFRVKSVWSGTPSIGKSIELISGYDSSVKMAAIGYNLTDVNLGSTYGGDLTFHTQPLYGSPTTPLPERMRISSSGYVTKPDTPAFIVRHTSAEVYSANTYIDGPWTVTLNRGSHFNTGNGVFTAPVAGLYQINCMQNNDYGNGSYPSNFRIHVNNSLYAGLNFDQLDSHSGWFTHTLVGTLNLARNDTVRLFTSSAARVDNNNWNHYSLYLIG